MRSGERKPQNNLEHAAMLALLALALLIAAGLSPTQGAELPLGDACSTPVVVRVP